MSRSRCAHRHLQLLNFWPEVAGAPTVTTCAGKHCMASPCPAPAFLPTAVLSPACPTCSEVPAYLELLRRAAAKGVHPQVRPGSLLHRMSHPAHLLSALATTCTPGFGWQRRCMYGSPPTAFWPHTLQTVGGTCHTAQQPLTDKGLLPCPQLLLVDGFGVLHPRRCGSASHLGVLSGLPTGAVGRGLCAVYANVPPGVPVPVGSAPITLHLHVHASSRCVQDGQIAPCMPFSWHVVAHLCSS